MNPTPHCTNRMFEWFAATIMTMIGIGVPVAHLSGLKVVGAFNAFTDLGMNPVGIGAVFLIAGLARCYALYANGTWQPHGSYLRMAGCAIGVLLWMQLLYGVAVMIVFHNQIYTVTFVWLGLALFEGFSLSRAVHDRTYPVKLKPIGVRANAARNR